MVRFRLCSHIHATAFSASSPALVGLLAARCFADHSAHDPEDRADRIASGAQDDHVRALQDLVEHGHGADRLAEEFAHGMERGLPRVARGLHVLTEAAFRAGRGRDRDGERDGESRRREYRKELSHCSFSSRLGLKSGPEIRPDFGIIEPD